MPSQIPKQPKLAAPFPDTMDKLGDRRERHRLYGIASRQLHARLYAEPAVTYIAISAERRF